MSLRKVDIWLNNQTTGDFRNNSLLLDREWFCKTKDAIESTSPQDVEKEVYKKAEMISCPSGMSISFGSRSCSRIMHVPGESGALPSEQTFFDLASITKFFLSLVYLYFYENGQLSLEKEIGYYSSHFNNIGNLRIKDLLSFNVNLFTTSKRIDECGSIEEALNVLYEIEGGYSLKQVYSDMPSMVLGELLEDIVGMDFSKCLLSILRRSSETIDGIKWGESLKSVNCMNYSDELWLVNGKYVTNENPVGMVNDKKARLFALEGNRLCGHAGLFASVEGISAFNRSFLKGDFIKLETIKAIAEGSGWQYCSESQSFGYHVYRKYPNARQTEVPLFLSGFAIGASGFTGCYLCLDILNGISIFIGGNRLKDSLSKIVKSEKPVEETIIYKDKHFINKLTYVYERDELRDYIAKLALVKAI